MDWIKDLRQAGDHAVRLDTDLEYFAAELLKIRPKAGSLVPFTFNPAQRELHRIIEEQRARTGRVRVIVLKARQLGISTYVAARYYKQTTSNPGFANHHHRARKGSIQKPVPACEALSRIYARRHAAIDWHLECGRIDL